MIIDYKWRAYAHRFFVLKILIYIIFIIFFFLDLDSVDYDMKAEHEVTIAGTTIKYFGLRVKHWKFFTRKGICCFI